MDNAVWSRWTTVSNCSHTPGGRPHAGKKGYAVSSTRGWLGAVQPVPTARAWLGQHSTLGGRHGARFLLLAFDFGKPAGDMGMPRLELACLVKGGARFVKLPRH